MSHAEPQGQRHHSVFREVVFGQLHGSIEDGYKVLGFQLLRVAIRPVAFQAECVRSTRAQQVIVVSPVRSVASGATLLECWLVAIWFFPLIGDITVAAQADVNRIRLGKSWLTAGVRTVAVQAIARSSGMLNFRRVDQLGFIVMASYAQSLGVGLRENDFPILGWGVADFALPVGEWGMRELRHQLGPGGFVWIVTAHAVCRLEWLILM